MTDYTSRLQVASASVVLIVGPLFLADGGRLSADERSLPASVIAIIENAERLRSGEYSVRATLKSTHWSEGPGYSREGVTTDEFSESIEARFDLDSARNVFRSKRTKRAPPTNAHGRVPERYHWYLGVPGLTVELRGDETLRAAIIRAQTPWTEIWPGELSNSLPQPVFDPRLLGWSGWGSLGLGFDEFAESWFRRCEIRATDEGQGIERVECAHTVEEGYTRVLTLWCDARRGRQPIRSSTRWRYAIPVPNAEQRNAQAKADSETQQNWDKRGDVWVLTSLAASSKTGTADNELEMSVAWSSVNEPIPAEGFDWKTWNFPKDYQELIDMRLGAGRPVNVTDHRGPPYEIRLPIPLDAPKEPNGWQWLITINVAALAVVAGWLARYFTLGR